MKSKTTESSLSSLILLHYKTLREDGYHNPEEKLITDLISAVKDVAVDTNQLKLLVQDLNVQGTLDVIIKSLTVMLANGHYSFTTMENILHRLQSIQGYLRKGESSDAT